MESKIKKYELNQNGKKYILSIQIYEDKLRFACIEYYQEKQSIFIGEFTLTSLMQISSIFSNLTEISKALEIFDSLILNQKVNIQLKENFLYLNILIKKENSTDEKFSIKLILFNGIKSENNIQITEKKVITTTNISSNNYNLTTDNNINKNELYSPITQNKENEEKYTQEINDQFIKSPIINNETKEHQLINTSENINLATNEQLIQSSNINTNINVTSTNQDQLILSPNHLTNVNSEENQYIQTSGEINAISNEEYIQSSQEQNINSQNIGYSQEKKDIQITNVNGNSSEDNYIQQFLQSSGTTSSQEQYITDQSPLNIEEYLKSQQNTNTDQQYMQDYNINLTEQNKQISDINNIQINQATTTKAESQYIQQPNEIITNINSYESYFQQPTSNISTTENAYIQSVQQPKTISSNTTTTQTNYVQIPTTKITTQKQYIIQNQPLESQTVNYNISQNQVKKTKKIKTEKIVLSLLPQPREEPVQPKIEETNYEASAQIYEPAQPQPQIIVQDNPELDNLRAENARLKEEIRILKSNTIIKSEISNNNQEILLLREEIERLRLELTRFGEYKLEKEDEINMLNIKIQTLLNKQKELERMNADLREYIEKLKKIKSGSEDVQKGESLTIQDTRLEIIRGDIIENPKELELLTRRMCNQKYKKISLNLLYKAIFDSDKASVFHKKCDSANCSLVLVRSANGKRFGGFTSCNWQGNSIEKKDENAFIFSLDKLKIYNVIEGEDAIGCYPSFGPVFLGCQIRIYDNFFKNGGTTFEKGLNYDTEEDFELTGGLKKFDIKDIEVYSVELFAQ